MERLTSQGMKGVQKFTPPGSHLDLLGGWGRDALALLGFLPSSPLDVQILSEVIKRPNYPRCNTTDTRRGN